MVFEHHHHHLRSSINASNNNNDTHSWLAAVVLRSLFTPFKKRDDNDNAVGTITTSNNNNNIITSLSSSSIILMIVTTTITIATFTILPFTLATITLIRQKQQQRKRRFTSDKEVNNDDDNIDNDMSSLLPSSLYYGKVWHTRYYPKKHHFQYPIFIFGLNLHEVINKRLFTNTLWPLSPYIIQFDPLRDHFKQYKLKHDEKNNTSVEEQTIILCNHIYELISNRTLNKFIPNHNTHIIYLITHLSYYNYCFNPVSFYFIIRRKSSTSSTTTSKSNVTTNNEPNDNNDDIRNNKNDDEGNSSIIIDAIVGEVSNTPWNEMYCYVLHPYAQEIDEVQQIITTDAATTHKKKKNDTMNHNDTNGDINITSDNDNNNTNHNNDQDNNGHYQIQQQPINEEDKQEEEVNHQQQNIQLKIDEQNEQEETKENKQSLLHYIFPKRFHVSPFMEMSYYYEWKFYNLFHINKNTNTNIPKQKRSTIHIINNLLRLHDTNIMQFHAQMIVHETSIHPYRIVYHMITYPIYCITIQIWIHYEAMILFIIKGVSYQPHPNESETTASRIIGTIMTPFFYNWNDIIKQSISYFQKK